MYYCSVVSAQDLDGNNEAYAELIVLGEWGWVPRALGWGSGSRYSFCPLLCVHPLSSSYHAGPCHLLATTLWHCQSLGIHCALHPGQNPSLYGISNQPESEWRELRTLLVSDFKDIHMEAEAGGVRVQEMLQKTPNLNNMQKQRAFIL